MTCNEVVDPQARLARPGGGQNFFQSLFLRLRNAGLLALVLGGLLFVPPGRGLPASAATPLERLPLQAAQTVSFQEGVSPTTAYAGGIDTTLSQAEPGRNFGFQPELLVDGDDPPDTRQDKVALLRWDVKAIPSGSRVQSASLTITVFNASSNTYSLFPLKRIWSESEASWNQVAGGASWQAAGAQGAGDRGQAFIGSLVPSRVGAFTINLNAAGLATLQEWVSNPAANFGLIFASALNVDGFDFYSNEAPTPASRPKLTVTYSQGESAPPANETSGSPFASALPRPAGVQATLNLMDSTFNETCGELILGQTLQVGARPVLSELCFWLTPFDANQTTNLKITRPDGSIYANWALPPFKNSAGFTEFFIVVGQPLGQYTLRFSQGSRLATAVFTLEAARFPTLLIAPQTVSPGKDMNLQMAGFAPNTILSIYRFGGQNNDGTVRWDYRTHLPPVQVNARGEATFVVHTRPNDPLGDYLLASGFNNWKFALKRP